MIVLEFKAKGKTTQYESVDEAIRTAQSILLIRRVLAS
jgi:putative transposase